MSLPEKPITPAEQYLASIAGQETALPEQPVSRMEQYLDYIAKNGGGVFVATYTLTPTESGFTATCNKTYEELYAAYTSGKQLQARCLNDALGMDLRLTSYSCVQEVGGNAIIFLGIGQIGSVGFLSLEHYVTNGIITHVTPLATAN